MKNALNSTTAIVTPALSTADAIIGLNKRYLAADQTELQSDREKLLVVIEGRSLITSLGGPTGITTLVAEAGITGKFKDIYSEGAQLITGFVIAPVREKLKKKRFRNLVARAAKLMLALDNAVAAGEKIGNTSAQIADWVEQQEDGWTGVMNKFASANAGGSGDEEDDVENVVDLGEYRRALEIGAFKLPIPTKDAEVSSMNAALPSISVHQRSGDDLLVLPLNLPAELMEQLRPYLPAADAQTTDIVRFWGSVANLCQLFDRADSSVPLRADMEGHDGEAKAPCRPIVRILENGDLSIASSRVVAGMVVEASASIELGLDKVLAKGFHINGTGTNALVANLSAPTKRTSYDTASLQVDKGKYWLKFGTRLTDVKDLRVRLLPVEEFGSSRPQWTLGVRSEFNPEASTTLTMPDGILPAELVKFAGKVSGSKHAVTVGILAGKLSLALNKSAAWDVDSDGAGDAKADIGSSDFARVFEVAKELRAVGCAFSIDSMGLVAIRFATASGDFTVHIPTLLEGGARNPALLRRIEKPRAAADETAAA